jgi:glycosyltransferase involved in cell wall biosynthesis
LRSLETDAEFLPNLGRAQRQDFLRTLSVLSVPTKRPEAYGMYVLEALASGVPVVAPRHGGIVELVEETGGGLLVEPNDPPALAEALAALLLDPEKAQAMAERGRRAVAEKFDARRTARDVVAVFEQTIAGV